MELRLSRGSPNLTSFNNKSEGGGWGGSLFNGTMSLKIGSHKILIRSNINAKFNCNIFLSSFLGISNRINLHDHVLEIDKKAPNHNTLRSTL